MLLVLVEESLRAVPGVERRGVPRGDDLVSNLDRDFAVSARYLRTEVPGEGERADKEKETSSEG